MTPKIPMTDEEIRMHKPVSPDFVDFRAGIRCAERVYQVADLYKRIAELEAQNERLLAAASVPESKEEIKEAAYNKLMDRLEDRHKRIDELKAQNALLLEALKACASVCAGHSMSKGSLIAALEMASAAIAQVEGKI